MHIHVESEHSLRCHCSGTSHFSFEIGSLIGLNLLHKVGWTTVSEL